MNSREMARYEVEFTYASLADGESSKAEICPSCEGGSTKEKSFGVSRSGGVLLYNCHRSSCGFRGAIGVPPGSRESTASTKGVRRNPYIKVSQLDEDTLNFLAEKFGLSRTSIEFAGLGWTGELPNNYGRRVCYPIYGPDSRERGASYRSYEAGVTPKSIIHLHSDDAIGQSWYKFKRRSKKVIIVEDQVSAIKMADYMHSVALLGTNLNESKLNEIKAGEYDHVYLCLDNDATSTAIMASIKYRASLPQLQVVGLTKDIKNMDDDELEEFRKKLEDF